MSIDKTYEGHARLFTPVCDICGAELPAEYDFSDAVAAKKAAGWKSKKIDDAWIDVCPECQINWYGLRKEYDK